MMVNKTTRKEPRGHRDGVLEGHQKAFLYDQLPFLALG